MRVVAVHGAGASGARAWPRQAGRPGWQLLERTGTHDDPVRDAARVTALLGDGGAVVGASYGGITAVLAAADPRVRRLVLLEPALLAAAPDAPAVAEHVSALGPVFALPAAVDDLAWSDALATASGWGPHPGPDDARRADARRLRATPPPWTVPVDLTVLARVPTLVVTGGERPLYEAVAEVLVRHGATHRVVVGAGHRVQDHPEADDALTAWLAG